MANMAQNKDYAALTDYLSAYLSNVPESLSTYCTNIPINALLNYYAGIMDQTHISRNRKIGLSSISAIADKYHGMAQFTHTDHEFITNIVLEDPD